MLSFSANAFDLSGAWVTDEANCGKVFVKKRGRISMVPRSDAFGGGFIIEGDQIRGPLLNCKISNRKEEGGVLYLMVSCSTNVALLDPMQFSVRSDGDNKIKRVFPNFPEIAVHYSRCTM
jgi:hypothetical protein